MLTDKENERSRCKSSYGLCTCFCVCNEKEMMNMPAIKIIRQVPGSSNSIVRTGPGKINR